MVTYGQRKMLPMAPASAIGIPPPALQSASKPKIGFSIDSIVGSVALQNHSFDSSLSPRSENSDRPSSPPSDSGNFSLELRQSQSNEYGRNFRFISEQDFRIRLPVKHTNNNEDNDSSLSRNSHSSPPPTFRSRLSPDRDYDDRFHKTRSPSPRIERLPPETVTQPTNKGPIVVPGIPAGLIRPHAVQPPTVGDLKSAAPPFMNAAELGGGQQNAHYLAAQFQMAAALAHGQAGQGFAANMGLHSMAHHPQFTGGCAPNMIRDSYPLYPWLLSRHGRIFPHRFPGNFLLQPFRKPKRVRTAFSPTQLLKLEHAFEGNHYVVGAERKTLAQTLSLTETQVKVWFQNRRTKHKRMQQEENSTKGSDGGTNGNGSNAERNGSNATSCDEDDVDEDELIDMDDCSSDPEGGDFDH